MINSKNSAAVASAEQKQNHAGTQIYFQTLKSLILQQYASSDVPEFPRPQKHRVPRPGQAQRFVFLLVLLSVFLSGCATWELGSSGQRKINGKTFVIVGASSGFGRGVAEQVGAYGANVVLAARRTELLEEVAGNVREAGGNALVVTMDISKPEDVQRVAEAAILCCYQSRYIKPGAGP